MIDFDKIKKDLSIKYEACFDYENTSYVLHHFPAVKEYILYFSGLSININNVLTEIVFNDLTEKELLRAIDELNIRQVLE